MFTKVYALPNFNVPESDWDKYLVSLERLDEAHATGKTLAVQLPETNYGVLDFDAHAGSSGIELYEELKSQFPEFFNSTRVEKTGNGGIHVYFNKSGKFNQNALKDRGEVDVFHGYGKRWMVIGESRFKDGKPAEYKTLNHGPVQDLPAELEAILSEKKVAPVNGNRSLNMPKVITPPKHEMALYTDVDGDWDFEGTGREGRLFTLIVGVYRKGVGTPEVRMGKALWLLQEVFKKATLPFRNAWTIEDWWEANKTLSAILDEDINARKVKKEVVPTAPAKATTGLQIIDLRTVKVTALEYLWTDRIVNGVAALIPAKQGMGKSTIAIDLAASLSRGKLPGKYYGTPKSTFILAAEDDEASVMVPRALVNNFDFSSATISLANYKKDEDGSLSLPNIKDALNGLAEHEGFDEHALVVVDTPVKFLAAEGDAATNSYGNVMNLMTFLNGWAHQHKKTVLLLWHLNKDGETMGSAGWEAGVRNVIKLEEDPDSTDEVKTGLLHVSKLNGAPTSAPVLRYTLTNTPGVSNGVSYNAAKVTWSEAYKNNREMREDLQDATKRSTVDVDIINLLEENGPSGRQQILEGVDSSRATVSRALSRLTDSGKIFKSKKQFQGGVQYALTPFEEPAVEEEWLVEG